MISNSLTEFSLASVNAFEQHLVFEKVKDYATLFNEPAVIEGEKTRNSDGLFTHTQWQTHPTPDTHVHKKTHEIWKAPQGKSQERHFMAFELTWLRNQCWFSCQYCSCFFITSNIAFFLILKIPFVFNLLFFWIKWKESEIKRFPVFMIFLKENSPVWNSHVTIKYLFLNFNVM